MVHAVMADAGIFVRRLEGFIPLSASDEAVLREFTETTTAFEANSDVFVEGDTVATTYLIRSGWAMHYKLLPDGRRQITHFLLPGDIFGFRESLFQVADCSVEALTDLVVHPVPASRMIELANTHPNLALALTWARLREQAILTEHIVRLGRRSAFERTAHLLMELLHRLEQVGLTRKDSYVFPLTQERLADALGLSIVHVNRTLRRLRRDNLISLDVDRRHMTIRNADLLSEVAHYDIGFLDHVEDNTRAIDEILPILDEPIVAPRVAPPSA